MTKIAQNISNYNASPVQKNSAQEPRRPIIIPEYYVEKTSRMEELKESFEKSPVYTIGIKAFFGEFIEHPIASFGAWLGIGYLFDKYMEGIGGKYETSLLGKAARLGDRIEQSKFVQSKPVQSVLKGLGIVKKKGAEVVQGNSVLKAMKETPSRPEWPFVQNEMISQTQRITEDFMHIMNRLHLTDDKPIELERLALTKKDKELLKKTFNVTNISSIPEELAANHVVLSRLGVQKDTMSKILLTGTEASTALTKQTVLDYLELDANKLKLIEKDEFGKYTNDVLKASKKLGNKVRIKEGHHAWMGPVSRLFERTVSCDQIYNRLHSIGSGAKTSTGRFFSKAIQVIQRGITFGGGKTGLLIFIAPAAVVAAINVHKAENNQKVGTGVSSIVNSISWVLTFPLALKMMHTLGGAQYAGMGKEKVAKYRKIISDFNEANEKGKFKTYSQYKDAKKIAKGKLDKLYKVKGQNIFTRGIRKLARGMTLDLGRFNVYNTGNSALTFLSRIRNFPRNAFGVPLRFLIWAGIGFGVLDVLIEKGVKLVFGSSYDSAKEEEIKEAKKEEKRVLKQGLQKALYETQRKKINGQMNAQQNQNNPQVNTPSHKGLPQNNQAQNVQTGQQYQYIPQASPVQIDKKPEEKVDNYTYIPSQDNVIPSPKGKGKLDTYTYVPSQDSTVKSEKGETNATNVRSYIPSQAAANIQKTWDNSGLESALARADRAENRALKILAGDFEGM